MLKFRPQRGALSDSMLEAVEVNGIHSLRAYLNDANATIRPYDVRPDARIGWLITCIVISGDGYPVGFTDGLG